MATRKNVFHAVNDKGAVVCPNKTAAAKLPREAWDALPKSQQCGNCARCLARKEGRERVHLGSVSIRKTKDANGRNLVTGDARASYVPRHGQV